MDSDKNGDDLLGEESGTLRGRSKPESWGRLEALKPWAVSYLHRSSSLALGDPNWTSWRDFHVCCRYMRHVT